MKVKRRSIKFNYKLSKYLKRRFKINKSVLSINEMIDLLKEKFNFEAKKESCEKDFERFLSMQSPNYLKTSQEKKEIRKALYTSVNDENFLSSYAWRSLRYQALLRSDGLCQLCGRGKQHGVVLNVDHIKSRRKYSDMAMDINNLQVLCHDCNHGKGNWDETDWRIPVKP